MGSGASGWGGVPRPVLLTPSAFGWAGGQEPLPLNPASGSGSRPLVGAGGGGRHPSACGRPAGGTPAPQQGGRQGRRRGVCELRRPEAAGTAAPLGAGASRWNAVQRPTPRQDSSSLSLLPRTRPHLASAEPRKPGTGEVFREVPKNLTCPRFSAVCSTWPAHNARRDAQDDTAACGLR